MLSRETKEDINQMIQGAIAAFDYLCQEDWQDADGSLLLFSENEQLRIFEKSLNYDGQTKLKSTAIKSSLLHAWQSLLNGEFATLLRKHNIIINPDKDNENLKQILDDYIYSEFIPKAIYKPLFDNQGKNALGRITLDNILFPALLCKSSTQVNYEGFLVGFNEIKNYPLFQTPKDYLDFVTIRINELVRTTNRGSEQNPYFNSLTVEMDQQNLDLAIKMSLEVQNDAQRLRQRRQAAPQPEGFAQRELQRREQSICEKYCSIM